MGGPRPVKSALPEEDWLRAEREIRTRSSAAEANGLHEQGLRTWF
jgi:hypothetical protein